MNLARLIRALPALALLVVLAACDAKDMGDPPHPMGNFKMNAFFIDAQKAQTVPLSRTAKPEDWETVMADAMTERFGTYAGDKPFEFGISIDGYVLAPRGVPVVAPSNTATGIPQIDNPSHIIPVMVGDPVKCKYISDRLLEDYGIYIQPINYPTVPKGTERLRITPSPVHTDADIQHLIASIGALWSQCQIARIPVAAQ